MKKSYVKPEILFEDFSMSTNIAGDCEVKTNSPALFTCAYTVKIGPMTRNLFTSAIGACTTNENGGVEINDSGDGRYNTICYHVFDGGNNNLFNS